VSAIANDSDQIEHPNGSQIIALYALNETTAVMMTVLMDGELYVFDLRSGKEPDVAVTLLEDPGTDDYGCPNFCFSIRQLGQIRIDEAEASFAGIGRVPPIPKGS
jgi:hypothetical protein